MAPKRKHAALQRPNPKQSSFVECPACQMKVIGYLMNNHLDWDCLTLQKRQSEAKVEYRTDSEVILKQEEDGASVLMSGEAEKGLPVNIGVHDKSEARRSYKQDELKGPNKDLNVKVDTEGIAKSSSEASTASLMKSTNGQWKFITSLPALKAPRGHLVLDNFISSEEEQHLLCSLDMDPRNPWKVATFNGLHRSKAHGVVIDLRRRLVKPAIFEIPKILHPILERMRATVPVLKEFWPNEINAIDYCKDEGHWLKPHVDDRQLSGTVLVNLSLCGACKMTYERERGPPESYKVLLKPRCIQILTGESRYNFTHSIQNQDLLAPRRVSLTFRQSVLP